MTLYKEVHQTTETGLNLKTEAELKIASIVSFSVHFHKGFDGFVEKISGEPLFDPEVIRAGSFKRLIKMGRQKPVKHSYRLPPYKLIDLYARLGFYICPHLEVPLESSEIIPIYADAFDSEARLIEEVKLHLHALKPESRREIFRENSEFLWFNCSLSLKLRALLRKSAIQDNKSLEDLLISNNPTESEQKLNTAIKLARIIYTNSTTDEIGFAPQTLDIIAKSCYVIEKWDINSGSVSFCEPIISSRFKYLSGEQMYKQLQKPLKPIVC